MQEPLPNPYADPEVSVVLPNNLHQLLYELHLIIQEGTEVLHFFIFIFLQAYM